MWEAPFPETFLEILILNYILYPSRLHLDLGGSAPLLRSHPKPGSRTRLPRREPAAPHPCLTSFSQASRPANPELVGTHSSNNSPASPTHQPAKFPRRQEVSGFTGFLSPSQAFGLLGSDSSNDLPSRGTVLGTAPIFPTCGAGSVQRRPVPSPCQSGLQVAGLVAPPLSPRRPGIWKVCVRRRRVSQS